MFHAKGDEGGRAERARAWRVRGCGYTLSDVQHHESHPKAGGSAACKAPEAVHPPLATPSPLWHLKRSAASTTAELPLSAASLAHSLSHTLA